MEALTSSPEETAALAKAFAMKLVPKEERATVVGLTGELGAGKTAFAQAVAATLGATERASSPTFVIERRYPLSGSVFSNLIHIDAYRLESATELEELHFNELLTNPSNIILIEWAERVRELLPQDALWLRFEAVDEGRRRITS